MRWLIAVALASCACPSKPAATGATTGSGIGRGSGTPTLTGCDAITAKVQGLYRAEAQAAEKSARVEESVADNTAMVIAECRRAPDKVTACIAGVTTVKDLESQCLPKLDEEGSEADGLAH